MHLGDQSTVVGDGRTLLLVAMRLYAPISHRPEVRNNCRLLLQFIVTEFLLARQLAESFGASARRAVWPPADVLVCLDATHLSVSTWDQGGPSGTDSCLGCHPISVSS